MSLDTEKERVKNVAKTKELNSNRDQLLHGVGDKKVDILSLIQQQHGS